MDSNKIYDLVQSRYGELAQRPSTTDHAGLEGKVAEAFGYTALELSAIPKDANLGVSCGNPLALANLREASSCPEMRLVVEILITDIGRGSCRLGQWRGH